MAGGAFLHDEMMREISLIEFERYYAVVTILRSTAKTFVRQIQGG